MSYKLSIERNIYKSGKINYETVYNNKRYYIKLNIHDISDLEVYDEFAREELRKMIIQETERRT